MIISFRERFLLKSADEATKAPFNKSERSKQNRDGTTESDDTRPEALQVMFDIPMDEKRVIDKDDLKFIGWGEVNALGDKLKLDDDEEEEDAE
jgi:hypothetical protein